MSTLHDIEDRPSKLTAAERQRVTELWSRERLTAPERRELRAYEQRMRSQ